jgi:hypothetical protein
VRDVGFFSVAATTGTTGCTAGLSVHHRTGQDGVTRAGYNGLGTLAEDPYHLSALVRTRAMGPQVPSPRRQIHVETNAVRQAASNSAG